MSMRSLRSSIANDLISTRTSSSMEDTLNPSRTISSTKDSPAFTTYNVAPKQKLNLVDIKLKVENKKDKDGFKTRFKETRRMRKRREWRTKQEKWKNEQENCHERFDGWMYLPDIILEQIFQYLTYKERLNCMMCCSQWYFSCWIRSVWSRMDVTGNTMATHRYIHTARDYQAVLDHMRVSAALHKIGQKIKSLSFLPEENLHNIVEFQNVMIRNCDAHHRKFPNIKSFTYVFPCDFARKHDEVEIYGTGGMILQNMKKLLEYLPGLERLELVDLQLEGADAEHVLDEVADVCSHTLRILKVVNISRLPFSMLAVTTFVNLRCLIISPHNLGDDLVECFAGMPKLKNLQIVSNATSDCVPTPVDYRIWSSTRKCHPRLRVHLVTEGKHKKELTFQTKAPVKSIVYDSPYTPATEAAINIAVQLYKTDLEVYCHKRLPRFYRSKKFFDRADSSYLYLVRQCPYLHTLMIRERISSSTVLLLAYTGKNLRYFNVRKNGVILRCDWPKSPEWSDEFYKWLTKNSQTYVDMEREVSQIFGFRWYALNDKQFCMTPINLNVSYYYEGFEEAD